jgi:hypothetical protein
VWIINLTEGSAPMTDHMSRMTRDNKGNGEMNTAIMIDEVRRMNREMLMAEFRGPGDTLEAAAYRHQTKRGVPFATTMRLWNREINDMLISSAAPVLNAYLAWSGKMERAAERMEAQYEEKRTAASNSVLVRLADFVAGRAKKGTDE